MSDELTRKSQECSLIHGTSKGYLECVNEGLSDPYTVGYEKMRPAPSSSIGGIMGFIAVIVIIILIYLSVKAKVNPFDLIMSFFR